MDFRHAFFEMLSGRAVRLPDWSGYWTWENGTIMMHGRDGSVMDIRETKNPGYTFSNIAEKTWEVCEPVVGTHNPSQQSHIADCPLHYPPVVRSIEPAQSS